MEDKKLKKMKKGFSFIVLVITIAGMMTAFVTVQGYSTFNGYVKNNEGNPISGVTVILADCYYYILGVDTTDSQGYYSFSVTLNGNSPYYLTATPSSRYDSDLKIVYSGGTNNFELEGNGEKIAVFFYATDAGNTTKVNNDYKDILELEGYTTFFDFPNSDDVESDCQEVDDYELDVDTVFVYIWGHGLYDGDSYTYFKHTQQSKVYADDFRDYVDEWDAERICILVESCYSGNWADDFAATPYLAMSSADETHEAYYYGVYEGKFSYYFFNWVLEGHTAVQSFWEAEDYCDDSPYIQNPKIQDYSTYVWFN
ncbi:MAG: hypothetical protein FK730_08090 [Asgard group archaeon]|nr:hypothetical protein [Asgard group archaeon]